VGGDLGKKKKADWENTKELPKERHYEAGEGSLINVGICQKGGALRKNGKCHKGRAGGYGEKKGLPYALVRQGVRLPGKFKRVVAKRKNLETVLGDCRKVEMKSTQTSNEGGVKVRMESWGNGD